MDSISIYEHMARQAVDKNLKEDVKLPKLGQESHALPGPRINAKSTINQRSSAKGKPQVRQQTTKLSLLQSFIEEPGERERAEAMEKQLAKDVVTYRNVAKAKETLKEKVQRTRIKKHKWMCVNVTEAFKSAMLDKQAKQEKPKPKLDVKGLFVKCNWEALESLSDESFREFGMTRLEDCLALRGTPLYYGEDRLERARKSIREARQKHQRERANAEGQLKQAHQTEQSSKSTSPRLQTVVNSRLLW